jgi:hypothetical protein
MKACGWWSLLLGAAFLLAPPAAAPSRGADDAPGAGEYLIDLKQLRDGRNSNRCKKDAVEFGGKTYSRALSPPVYGSKPVECAVFELPEGAVSLDATIGVLDAYTGTKTARLSFWGLKDGSWQRLGSSGVLKKGSPPERVTAGLRGCRQIAIYSEGNGYRAPGTFWIGDARITAR